jgi:hypothetical protein
MKVRALTRCFIKNCLRQEGEIFDYDGPGNGCVVPVEDAPPVVEKKPPASGKKAKPPTDAAFD